jgi:hypothetical protein
MACLKHFQHKLVLINQFRNSNQILNFSTQLSAIKEKSNAEQREVRKEFS